jgi:hypothetical protein
MMILMVTVAPPTAAEGIRGCGIGLGSGRGRVLPPYERTGMVIRR